MHYDCSHHPAGSKPEWKQPINLSFDSRKIDVFESIQIMEVHWLHDDIRLGVRYLFLHLREKTNKLPVDSLVRAPCEKIVKDPYRSYTKFASMEFLFCLLCDGFAGNLRGGNSIFEPRVPHHDILPFDYYWLVLDHLHCWVHLDKKRHRILSFSAPENNTLAIRLLWNDFQRDLGYLAIAQLTWNFLWLCLYNLLLQPHAINTSFPK